MTETQFLVLLAGLAAIILVQVIALLRGSRRGDDEVRQRALLEAQAKGLERLERELRDELARSRREDAEEAFRDREERAQSATLLGQALTTQVGHFGTAQSERLEAFARELNRFSLGLDERFERLRITVEGRLTAIQADNAGKLEEMRRTVDEKLHATLEQRLGESFKLVSDRLEQVHRGLGEMQSLAAGVGDLKRVLSNVKTRGTWGEVQLAALLEQLLTADQFAANVATRPDSSERVDFAIRLPGKGDGAVVWLPIDAKFPVEDYQRPDRRPGARRAGGRRGGEQGDRGMPQGRGAQHSRKICCAAAYDRFCTALSADRRAVCGGLAASGSGRHPAARLAGQPGRSDDAGGASQQPADGIPHAGHRAALGGGLGGAGGSQGRIRQVRRSSGVHRKKLDEASNSISKAETRTRQLSRKLSDVEALPASDAEKLIGLAELDGQDD